MGGGSCVSCCCYTFVFALFLLYVVFALGGDMTTYYITIGSLFASFIACGCCLNWWLEEKDEEQTTEPQLDQVATEPTTNPENTEPFRPPQSYLDQDAGTSLDSGQGLPYPVHPKGMEPSLPYNVQPTPSAPPLDFDMNVPPPSFEEAMKSSSCFPPPASCDKN